MRLYNSTADIYLPRRGNLLEALKKTTHIGIGAHQDDLEIMAFHGIAQCYKQKEQSFSGVICSNGAGSARAGKYKTYSDEKMRAVRIAEQRKAARIGKYATVIQLGYLSETVKNPSSINLVEDLKTILSVSKPKVIYTHNPADKHDTHVSVCLKTLQAIRELPKPDRPKKVYGCEVWRGLDWLLDASKVVLDVSGHTKLAQKLLACFQSQITSGKRYDLATLGRRRSNATYFQSHEVDNAQEVIFAMDLTPLLENEALSIEEYVLRYVNDLKVDISRMIQSQLIK